MRRLLAGAVVSAVACCALSAGAVPEPLTPISFRAAIAAAKAYAADRTLIFYCLRKDTDMVPFTYAIVQSEVEAALNKLRAAGSDAKQNAELVQAVLANVRFFPTPGPDDPALDAECKAKDVQRSYFEFRGSLNVPLASRPPFDKF